eukprot:gene4396-20621_t
MNLSAPVTDKAYAKHLNIISDAAKAEATENMLQAAKRVRDIILERNPELASEDEDGAVPAAITIDGTWHKRGFSSKQLKYTTFVGDGDSDTFRVVKECIENIYGSRYKVEKKECIGHIQKRTGTALRKLIKDLRGKKLEDGKPVGGRGRLTDVKVNQFQSN